MTRNASQYDQARNSPLRLVDRNGHLISQPQGEDETSAEYVAAAQAAGILDRPARASRIRSQRGQIIALAALSVGSASIAVAAGCYALWLSRSKVAEETLVSVHDLLETCRDRVTRMEKDLATIPIRS